MIDIVTQLLVPDVGTTYKAWDLTDMIVSEQGLSLPPINYLTQRGPYQHGDTVVGLRLEPRTIQLVLSKLFMTQLDHQLSRNVWINRLSPVNMGDVLAPVRPFIYRKYFYARYRIDLADLVLVNGSVQVTSQSASFVQRGLQIGQTVVITSGASAGTYDVVSIENENTVTLDAAMAADETGIACYYYSGTVVREIDVVVEDAPHLDISHDTLSRSRKDVLRLVAHDPIWRDTAVQTVSWAVDVSGNLIFYESPDWTDRLVFPIWFSGDFITSNVSLTYAGSWPTRPTITLYGPFTLFKLVNTTTNDTLVMNYTAVQGEIVTIDLYGLSAYNQAGADLTNYLYISGVLDSDLVTFQLAPHPIAPNGINTLHIEINDAAPQVTRAVMTWQSRYIGV